MATTQAGPLSSAVLVIWWLLITPVLAKLTSTTLLSLAVKKFRLTMPRALAHEARPSSAPMKTGTSNLWTVASTRRCRTLSLRSAGELLTW